MAEIERQSGLGLRVRAHDRLQLEIKSELWVQDPTGPRNSWRLDAWFVLPVASGIGPGHYEKAAFYEDLQTRLRLKTPFVGLEQLCRPNGANSPLSALRQIAEAPSRQPLDAAERSALQREPRLLCAMFKSELRDWSADVDAPAAVAPELAGHLEALTQTWRHLHIQLGKRPLTPRAEETLSFCDESLSVQIEAAALEHLAAIPPDAPSADRLRAVARAEVAHRAGHTWRTNLSDATAGAEYVDQARLLKRFTAAALSIRLRPNRLHGYAQQGVLAIAAALAMLWAVVAQIGMLFAWGLQPQRGVSVSFLMAFTVLAVVAYALKDRIKANASAALERRLSGRLSDRSLDLHLPATDRTVGRVSERMEFTTTADLPPDVADLHRTSARNLLLLRGERDVLRFTRMIDLRPRLAVASFPRLDGLTDVARLNVWRWIRTFARDRKVVAALEADGTVGQRKLRNHYFVDAFVRLQRLEPEPVSHLLHLKVALNRRGIAEVEVVDRR